MVPRTILRLNALEDIEKNDGLLANLKLKGVPLHHYWGRTKSEQSALIGVSLDAAQSEE